MSLLRFRRCPFPHRPPPLPRRYFWTVERRLAFLMDVSDRVEKAMPSDPLVTCLEKNAKHIVGTDWRTAISEDLLKDMSRFRK